VSSGPGSRSWIEQRFTALVRRELQAAEVELITSGSAGEQSDNVISVELEDGRRVIARFEVAPEQPEAIERRLSVLASTFAQSLREEKRVHARVPSSISLRDELAALAARARALDAFVIDAHSPVVWGSGRGYEQPIELLPELREAVRLMRVSRVELLEMVREELEARPEQAPDKTGSVRPPSSPPGPLAPLSDEAIDALTRRAVETLRALPGLTALKRGRPLQHSEASAEIGILAHSFASIYLLVLVFDGRFDELRSERSMRDALPRIERLVLALPPHDPEPSPQGNVVRFRRGK
jgi:hypothetical protein